MNVKSLIKNIALPLVIGIIVGLIMMPFNDYKDLVQPPFSPPAILFPIVWTILYILMGISSYLIYEKIDKIPDIYVIQLILNLLWSFVFFKFRWFTFAFIWILVLFITVLRMIKEFRSIDKKAGNLQIPYAIWLVVAAILNLMKIL